MDALFALLYVGCGVVAIWEARRKGYSLWLWLLAAFLLGPLALVAFMLLPMRTLERGEVVRFTRPVALEDGRTIPAGHVSVVRESRSLRGAVVCQVSDPGGALHWVEAAGLARKGARLDQTSRLKVS